MIELIEKLQDTASKINLIKQDKVRTKRIHDMFEMSPDARRDDLLHIAKKQLKALKKKHVLLDSLSKEIMMELDKINSELEQIKKEL